MSGITLEDIANEEAQNIAAAAATEVDPGEYDQTVVDQNRRNEFLKKLITTETGPGPISEYIDHPMNFNKSKGLARILRGLSGFMGNSLKLAIIDIVIGGLEFSKGRATNGINSGDFSNY